MKDQKVEATGVIAMKPEEAKSLYPGEWIAFRALEESDNPEGELVLYNKDCRAFDKELPERGLADVKQETGSYAN